MDLSLLGPVDVRIDGRPIDVDTRKAVALLALLAMADRGRSRDRLADLLWPESAPDRARGSLRRTLSALRSGLSERWVEADRSMVWFRPDDETRVDALRFAELSEQTHGHDVEDVCPQCIDPLSTAAGLYRGDFMTGFSIRDTPEFDDWMMNQAEHLRRRASRVFERLSTALANEGRYHEAIQAAGRWLDVDPLHEGAHRMSMRLHAWSGDRSGAIEQYRECVAILDRELGVEPLEETNELYQAILAEDLPRAPAPPRRPTAVPRSAAPYPLVGRDAAMTQIDEVISSGSGMIVIEGEVGVGKTRVLDELAGRAARSGTSVLRGRSRRTEAGVAYSPIQAALEEAVAARRDRIDRLPEPVRQEAARLFPALGRPPEPDPGDPAGLPRFLDALSQLIGALDDRVILAVDNLHWADAASLELLGFLAPRLERLGITLVVTRRPEDTPIDHPVSLLVEELSTESLTIRLDRLPEDAVAELVSVSGVEGVDPSEVYQKSRGLPFFVVEYLEAARTGSQQLPAAIRRLLLSRLGELDSVTRQVLTSIAVIGGSADARFAEAVSGRSETEVITGLDEAIRRSMLREADGATVDFVHDQLREVVYEETTLVRRRLLHRRAAEHLLSRHGSSGDARTVAAAAGHHLAAGNEAEAALLSVTAGEMATEVYAFADAAQHFETAIALGHPDRRDLIWRIGHLHTLTGAYGEALAAFEAARPDRSAPGEGPSEAAVSHAIGEIYRRLRRWEAAAASFRESMDGADPALASQAAADLAFVEHRRGDLDRARSLAQTALERAESLDDPDALAHVHNVAGLLADDPQERIAHLRQALEIAEHPKARAAILNNLAIAFAAAGDLDAAIEAGRNGLAIADTLGDRHRIAALHDNLADFFHQAGDEDEAMNELKAAVAGFAEVGVEPGSLEPEVWLLKEW